MSHSTADLLKHCNYSSGLQLRRGALLLKRHFLVLRSADSILCFLAGSIGSELTSTNVSVFITSDAGNAWRQVTALYCCRVEMEPGAGACGSVK